MLDRGGINNIVRLIHTIVNEKLLHYSRGSGGSGAPPIPPEVMKTHALDPDAGPHTGALTEDDVTFDDAAGHDHQGAADKGKKVDHANVDNVTTDQHHAESHAPAHKSGGAQPLDVKELVDSEGRLLTGAQKTDLTDGGLTVLHGHGGATTGAVQIILTNETGGERSSGDVVVTDPDNDESFIGTSGSGYQGKVLVVAETIASSGSGLCWERGGPFNIEVVGAVDRNDGLRTSATIYKAEAAESVISTGVFAIALSSSGSGGGTIKAVFLDAIGGGGGDGDGGGNLVKTYSALQAAEVSQNFPDGAFYDVSGASVAVTVDVTSDLIVMWSMKFRCSSATFGAHLQAIYDSNAMAHSAQDDRHGATAGRYQSTGAVGRAAGVAAGDYTVKIQWAAMGATGQTVYGSQINLVVIIVPQ